MCVFDLIFFRCYKGEVVVVNLCVGLVDKICVDFNLCCDGDVVM